MGHRQPLHRIVLPILVLLVAACGGTTTVSESPDASNAAGLASQVIDDRSAPPNGTLSSEDLVLDATGSLLPAADLENAVRAAGRTRATMAEDLGPDATVIAAAMDQEASDQLWTILDGAGVALAPRASTVILASVRLAGADREVAAGPPPGMSFLGPFIASLQLVESSMGTDRAFNQTKHDTSPVELGANTGAVTTDSTVSVTPDGSRLVVDVETTTKGEVTDANGRLVFRIDGKGHAHIDVQGCPDANGVASATLEFSANELYFVSAGGNRVGNSWQDSDRAETQIFANDAADLDHVVADIRTDRASKGGSKAAGDGQSTLQDEQISTVSPGTTIAPDGRMTLGDGTYQGHGTTMDEIRKAYQRMGELVGTALQATSRAAEKFWRSGKCVEVLVDPKGGDIAASSTTTVTAKVRHRFENVELNVPVEATMAGIKSIDPSGQKQPSPATFRFTAGPKPNDSGVVTFRSVSKRGIGETAVTFTVGGGWTVTGHDAAGASVTGQKCGGLGGPWKITGQINDSGLETTSMWVATIDEATLSGTYTYRSVGVVHTGVADITTTMTGNGRVSMVASADGGYVMTMAAITVTSTVSGVGSTQSVRLPIPALPFTWQPGGTCAG